jgi:CheY-like chemotaxis protein
MSPETIDRAFEPFFTTKEVGRGTGLGLSMVYSFVKQSRGEVTVASTVGVGTTVTLYLPKTTPQPVDAAKTDAEPLPTGARRVLVVEDDEQILRLIRSMLTDLGHQVFLARNGAEAIAILRGDVGLDLMISDVVMPHGMTGVELAREARKLRNDLKVLLASGYAGEVLARLRAVDEFPIIRKPFYRADLARCLRAVLHEA